MLFLRRCEGKEVVRRPGKILVVDGVPVPETDDTHYDHN